MISYNAYIVTGIMIILLPAILVIKDGVRDNADLIDWMMSKPLSFIVTLQMLPRLGMNIIFLGFLLKYWPN